MVNRAPIVATDAKKESVRYSPQFLRVLSISVCTNLRVILVKGASSGASQIVGRSCRRQGNKRPFVYCRRIASGRENPMSRLLEQTRPPRTDLALPSRSRRWRNLRYLI